MPPSAGEWSLTRLRATAALAALLVVALLTGAALWVWFQLHPSGSPSQAAAGTVTAGPAAGGTPGPAELSGAVQGRRDALAAAPMSEPAEGAALPAPLSMRDPGTLLLPSSSGTGPAGVPSGFPASPQGALAQLAALDASVLSDGSIARARQTIGQWAQSGGPTAQTWSAIAWLTRVYSALGLSGQGGPDSGVVIQATPMMGLVKAVDGPDWVLVCVDFEVQLTAARTVRFAAADCQRMTWTGRHWVIAAGPEPAPGPSIWPGTDAAITAGYKNLQVS